MPVARVAGPARRIECVFQLVGAEEVNIDRPAPPTHVGRRVIRTGLTVGPGIDYVRAHVTGGVTRVGAGVRRLTRWLARAGYASLVAVSFAVGRLIIAATGERPDQKHQSPKSCPVHQICLGFSSCDRN